MKGPSPFGAPFSPSPALKASGPGGRGGVLLRHARGRWGRLGDRADLPGAGQRARLARGGQEQH